MKIVSVTCFMLLSVCFVSFAQSPVTTAATSTQALQLLRQALAALSPNITTSDVTLTGSVHYIAGSDDENGTATLKALVTGASRMELDLPSGKRSEIRSLTGNAPAGQWVDAAGVSHTIAQHNLFNEPSWFSPVATIIRVLATPGYAATYVGAETLDSQGVQHISVSQQPLDATYASQLVPHLSQIDLYLDATTSLPAAIAFTIHPDNNALVDIPVKVTFSDYRAVSGTQVPFHVQRFLNNGLFLDLQFQSASINSGLSLSSLGIQ
jgi:hypothetical protein